MLEKRSEKTITALALAALLAVLALQSQNTMQATTAFGSGESSDQIDKFGIKEIYPTKDGREWYVNMDDPRNDPNFRNLGNVNFAKNSDGSWKVSADQIRMEAWSPENQKWKNVEITEYAKINSGSNELLQMYSRGGHHTSKDPCLGSAYKARLYGDGTAAWNKEITHPAYAGNRGVMQATTNQLEGRWVGFKAVIYNFEENGNTYVRLESYIDNDVTDESGHLVVKNNWKLASIYEDRGGWSTHDGDFDPSCGRERGEILTGSGGTATQNIAAFRSDDLTWSFKYLSVREIQPLVGENLPQSPLQSEPTDAPTEDNNNESNSVNCTASEFCSIIAGQHIPSGTVTMPISSIEMELKKTSYFASGDVTVAIMKDNQIVAAQKIDVADLSLNVNTRVVAHFDALDMKDSTFNLVVLYRDDGRIRAERTLDENNAVPGSYFDETREIPNYDLVYSIA